MLLRLRGAAFAVALSIALCDVAPAGEVVTVAHGPAPPKSCLCHGPTTAGPADANTIARNESGHRHARGGRLCDARLSSAWPKRRGHGRTLSDSGTPGVLPPGELSPGDRPLPINLATAFATLRMADRY